MREFVPHSCPYTHLGELTGHVDFSHGFSRLLAVVTQMYPQVRNQEHT